MSRSGVSGLTLLTIVFVVLKLTGVIAWSWWWVLAPTWIPLALTLFILLLAGMGLFVGMLWTLKS